MKIWEISIIILGFSFLLLVLFAIPTILQVRRTAKNVELALGSVNEKLPGILANLQHTAANVRETAAIVRVAPGQFRDVVAGFREVGGQVVRIERKWRDETQEGAGLGIQPVMKAVTMALGVFRVIRFFLPRGR